MSTTTTEVQSPTAFKPKKSVALSGTPAGNTALCTVGRNGNELHYRGYNILDLAASCVYEEVAYLLIHGKLPNKAELAGYKEKLRDLRGLPSSVRSSLELLPAATHPMDVLRTYVAVLGCVLPEKDSHPAADARDIADTLIASLGSALLYWYHFSRNGKRIAHTFCIFSTGNRQRQSGRLRWKHRSSSTLSMNSTRPPSQHA
jgi:2-methylcitrate synthase